MNAAVLSPLHLVDIALTNARDAGQRIDPATVAFLWRIVRGDASAAEVETWSRDTRAELYQKAGAHCADVETDNCEFMVAATNLLEELRTMHLRMASLSRR